MHLKRIAAAAACALFFVSVVDAHGPTRQRAEVSVEINAPADKVWAVVGRFDYMDWHPAVAETRAENLGTDEATRILMLENGATLKEEIRRYDEDRMHYAYRALDVDVDVLPVTNYSANLTVVPGDSDDSVTVEWSGAFTRGDPNNNPPEHLNDDAAVAAVTALYEEGLAALKEYIENGK